ncbi:MAG: nitroreductase family protein [Dehalococcoidia bacterium]|nr:nitroreductase family protein [Dehalococcoidia bacterium]MCA9857856.1 nitroreductase family protein [Dehalococcoidia bacterium]MCB9490563.1 nitroreductase family protein [Dehalococcoidia bacterium]
MEPISDVWELFPHQRAVRAFDQRPVPEEHITRILDAAMRAPSSQNGMPWRFIVVTDQAQKDALSPVYERCFDKVYGANAPDRAAGREPWSKTPVLIVVLAEAPNGRTSMMTGASVYPAVQNLMLAARALGLGSVITTLWRLENDAIRAILEVPEGWEIAAIVPVGYPDHPWGKSRRPPAADYTFRDRWGG